MNDKRLEKLLMLQKVKQLAWDWRGVILTVPAVAGLIIALRLAGWLQPLEWAAFDIYFQLRPAEPADKRILVVGVEESDIQKLGQWPASDQIFATLLDKIRRQRPRVIGLDIYRDVPVNPGREELVKVFKSTPNLIGVQKVIGDGLSAKIAPPPVLKQLNQVSAVDVPVDGDGVVRRGVLFPISEGDETIPSLGLAVALVYLNQQGINPTATNSGFMRLGSTTFVPFEMNDGGYVRTDAGGYQILLNYRGSARSFPQVSLTDVLENKIPPNIMRDRIVLIGVQAPSLNDAFYTPYSRTLATTPIRTPGVEIQANLASQVLSSVLDNRTLIGTWNEWAEGLWIIFWSGIIAFLGWQWRDSNNPKNFSKEFIFKLSASVSLAGISLISSSYLVFLSGLWIPVIPPLLALGGSALVISGCVWLKKLKESNIALEKTNQNLSNTLYNLRQAQNNLQEYSNCLEKQKQALQESESRLTLALEAAYMGIWEWNISTGVITVSENYEQIFGLEPGSFRGDKKAFLRSVFPEDRKELIQAIAHSVSKREDYEIEFRIVWSNGEIHWIEAIGQVFYNELGATRMLGTFRDVTERKQGDDTLFRSESKWFSLIQHISDVITIIYSDWLIQYTSPSTRRILGYTFSDVMGKNILEFVHPNNLCSFEDFLVEICENPNKIAKIEYWHRHKDDSWRLIESVAYNALSNPTVGGIIITSRDVTDLRKLELANRFYRVLKNSATTIAN